MHAIGSIVGIMKATQTLAWPSPTSTGPTKPTKPTVAKASSISAAGALVAHLDIL